MLTFLENELSSFLHSIPSEVKQCTINTWCSVTESTTDETNIFELITCNEKGALANPRSPGKMAVMKLVNYHTADNLYNCADVLLQMT